jgi:hypothetical protein
MSGGEIPLGHGRILAIALRSAASGKIHKRQEYLPYADSLCPYFPV